MLVHLPSLRSAVNFQQLLGEFLEATRKLVVGPPQEKGTNLGALVSADHLAKVQRFVKLAQFEGKLGCGTEPLTLPPENTKGHFMRPCVITDVADNSALMQGEIFGPVVCIVPFDSEDEVISRINSNKYGLCACVWTQNTDRLHRVAQKLQVGTVWCNCWLVRDLNMPFGGVKASGIGREGAKDSVDFFTEQKTICVKLN